MKESNNNKKKLAVIYARYSSDNQREESIEGQLRECREYAAKNGIEIIGTYIDRALSAKSDKRPDFQRMIADSMNREFSIVLVWALDRFARNKYDSLVNKRFLNGNGVKVVSITEPLPDSPAGRLTEGFLENMAQYYSDELSEKVSRGMTENVYHGKYNGGGLTLGYRIDSERKFQLDPIVAPVIAEVFTRYAEGATMKELAEYMTLSGVRSGRKNISEKIVSGILSNRRYLGEYRFREVVVPDAIPALVPPDVFERVQNRLELNKTLPAKKKAGEEYILTPKVFCGKCGSLMAGESGYSHTHAVYRYYKCSDAKNKGGCKMKSIRKDRLETIVTEEAKAVLGEDGILDIVADRILVLQKTSNIVLPALKNQLANAERGIDGILAAIEQGIISPATKDRLEALEKEKGELAVRIAEEEASRPKLTKEQVLFWLRRFCGTHTETAEQRTVLAEVLVKAVFVYDDRLKIIFRNGAEAEAMLA